MTTQSRANLKSVFEDGDTLTGANLVDLIDSFVNLVDTTAQSLASNLTVPNLAANSVSADSGYITNQFSTGIVYAGTLVAATARVSGDIFVSGRIKANGYIEGRSPHFEAYIQATAYVTASASDTYVTIFSGTGFDVTAKHQTEFTVSGNTIQYTGDVTAHVKMTMEGAIRGDVGTHVCQVAAFRDGSEVTASRTKFSVWNDLVTPFYAQVIWIAQPSAEVDWRVQVNTTAALTWEFHSLNIIGNVVHYEF